MRSTLKSRYVAWTALALAIVATALVLLRPSSSYALHAHFLNAGGLVNGDLVQIAGTSVGRVKDIDLTPDGQAEVVLAIDDDSVTPLHDGTTAAIRALGQAGVANHYVSLSPGALSARPLADGAVLAASQTTGLVSLDAVLNSFGPEERANLSQLITHSADIYAGSGSRDFNRMLARFDPALVQLKGLTDQLAGDSEALAGLIRTAATTTTAIASRDPELRDAVSNTAVTLRAIATQNHALADGLTRAPAVLRQAGTTLADATDAVNALRPALRDVGPAAGPLIGLLGRVDRVLPRTLPVVAELRGDLPQLREAFAGLPRLRPPAVNAFESAATALRVSRPIVHAVRLYGADLLIGVFQGLFSVGGAGYDANGHYVKLNYTQPYQNTFGGVFAGLLADPLAPDLFNLRQRLLRRCPGGNTAPAPDGSSPWVLDSSLCTAAHDTPATVNEPPKSIVGAP